MLFSAFVNVNFYREILVCRQSWVPKLLMKYQFGDPALPGILYFYTGLPTKYEIVKTTRNSLDFKVELSLD